jgi:hypothetical protein
MKVRGQHCVPLYLRVKTPVPTGQEAGWAPGPVWTVWRTDKSPVPAGITKMCLDPLNTDYNTDYTTGWPNHKSRFHSRHRQHILLFYKASGLGLAPPAAFYTSAKGDSYTAKKPARTRRWPFTSSNCQGKKWVELHLHFPRRERGYIYLLRIAYMQTMSRTRQTAAVRKQGFNCSVRYGLINSIRCQCCGCGGREVNC